MLFVVHLHLKFNYIITIEEAAVEFRLKSESENHVFIQIWGERVCFDPRYLHIYHGVISGERSLVRASEQHT